jgi:esterase/lipase superfamily enzyme
MRRGKPRIVSTGDGRGLGQSVENFTARTGATPSGRGQSLKRPFSVLALAFVAFSLVACAARPESGFLSAVALSPPGAVDHTLLVATTRERDDRPGTLFNGDRASATDYAEITVSIPPNHKQNEIEWATTPPGDPNVNFVVRDEKYLDSDKAFVQALNAQLALRPPGSRNVFLFVHGFNTMFAEAVYRGAQLAHDSKAPGVPVLFTWASRGQATAYVYDLNSATAARDGLEHTLRLLLRSNAEKVNVLAHSMGNWVTVEAFRQIRISGDLPPANKIGTIVLAAPDIDMDVFKAQLRRFGKPQKPFYVVLSQDDRALFLSRTIAGGVTRVGDSSDTAELTALGATVIDLTDVKATDATNHDKFVQLASVAPELRGILARGINSGHRATDASERAVSGVGSVVALPLTLLGAPIRIIANQ